METRGTITLPSFHPAIEVQLALSELMQEFEAELVEPAEGRRDENFKKTRPIHNRVGATTQDPYAGEVDPAGVRS